MAITLNLQPEIERNLLAQAAARGLSLADYLQEIVVRQAHAPIKPQHAPRTGQSLIDVCAKVRGLLTDEEVDALFSRTPAFSRPIDLE